jgi:hypothetical protein
MRVRFARVLWWTGIIWIALAIVLILAECALIWWVVSFEAFTYTISPLNLRNWMFAILILLPGWLLTKLAASLANRRHEKTSLPESNR